MGKCFKVERSILRTTKGRKTNWIGHILCRNCLLKHITEENIAGGIKVMGIQGRRRKQLLDYLKETRGYCKLKAEAAYRTVWKTCSGRSCGPVVGQLLYHPCMWSRVKEYCLETNKSSSIALSSYVTNISTV
jgi:hypothetical protein